MQILQSLHLLKIDLQPLKIRVKGQRRPVLELRPHHSPPWRSLGNDDVDQTPQVQQVRSLMNGHGLDKHVNNGCLIINASLTSGP